MNSGERIRLLIVDDHPSYAQGLSMLLPSVAPDLDVIGTASSGPSALEHVASDMPDVVLMDINMPGGGGIDAAKLIKQDFPVVKVVMLTVSEEDEDVFEAMKAGASGYLPKKIEVDELVTAVRAINQGQVVVSPTVAGKLLSGDQEQQVPLSDFESELLRLVAEGHDNAAIGRRLSISESTVKRNLRNIVEKLHMHNRVQAAVYAARKGWI